MSEQQYIPARPEDWTTTQAEALANSEALDYWKLGRNFRAVIYPNGENYSNPYYLLGEGAVQGELRAQMSQAFVSNEYENSSGLTNLGQAPALRLIVTEKDSPLLVAEWSLDPTPPSINGKYRDADIISLDKSYSAANQIFPTNSERRTVSDRLQRVGRPPLAYHNLYGGDIFGLICDSGWAVPEVEGGIALVGVNIATGERWELKGWQGVPSDVAAHFPGMLAADNPWGETTYGDPGLSHSVDYYTALGLVGPGQILVKRERHRRYPSLISNFNRKIDHLISVPDEDAFPPTGSWPSFPNTLKNLTHTVSGRFEDFWRSGYVAPFDIVTNPGNGASPGDFDPFFIPIGGQIGLISNCGGVGGNPTTAWKNFVNPTPGPGESGGRPHLQNYDSLTAAADAITDNISADFAQVDDYSTLREWAITSITHWWEVIDITDGTVLSTIDGPEATFTVAGKVQNGATVMEGPSGLTSTDLVDSEQYTGYAKLKNVPLADHVGVGEAPGGNLNDGHGAFGLFVSNFSQTYPGDEYTQTNYEIRSLDAGACAGALDDDLVIQPSGIYIYGSAEGFDPYPTEGPRAYAVAYFIYRFYSPVAAGADADRVYQSQSQHSDTVFATDGSVFVFLPRCSTGYLPQGVPSDPASVLTHNAAMLDLHNIRFLERPDAESDYEDTIMVNTLSLAGVVEVEDSFFEGVTHPNSGDWVTNPILSQGYLYGVVWGAWGEVLCKFAAYDGDGVSQGDLVATLVITPPGETRRVLPHINKSRENLYVENRHLRLVVQIGTPESEEEDAAIIYTDHVLELGVAA